MRAARSLVACLLAAAPIVAVAGCSDILGLKDLEPYPRGDDGALEDANGDANAAGDTSAVGETSAPPGDSGAIDGAHEDGMPASDGAPPPQDSGSLQDATGADGPEDSSGPPPADAPADTVQDSSTPMDAPCVGTPTDPHNCGACGHDCLGGGCANSVCEPFILANSVFPASIVSTGGSLYWVDQAVTGNVWTCTIADCGSTVHSIASGVQPEAIATDGTDLYYTDYGNGTTTGMAIKLPIGGGAATTLATGLAAPLGIAVDGAKVFWAEQGTSKIWRYVGGVKTQLTDTTATTPLPSYVVAAGGNVYWTDVESGYVESSSETTLAATPVAQGQQTPSGICVDATYVYWVDDTAAGTVHQKGIASGTTKAFSGDVSPVAIASDANQVYWVDQGTSSTSQNGALVGCSPSNCSPVVYGSGYSAPMSIAMDTGAVYFGTGGDDRLWMMVR